jgi:XTP/dITP diphosphohydrolase
LTNLGPLPRITLVIATSNPGKFKEIAALLDGLNVLLQPLDRIEVPPEGGESFQENAGVKATAVARASRQLALADDSGLEVEALGGQPGVRSARFGGSQATDADRNALILENLQGVPTAKRTARFRCVVAVADPQGRTRFAEGVCEGRIASAPRGTRGFGYDPIFEIPSLGKTFAEIEPEVKNRLSHRAKAMAGARVILQEILAGRAELSRMEPEGEGGN